jgi:peptidoglycan/LPS O-acetylase OafA/YrhL
MHAEIWNAPTWFLSSLTFATVILRFALPILAKMSKAELRRATLCLGATGLLPKIGYCYDTNGWGLMEGIMSPKKFPGLALYNVQRFNPFFATIEVLMGAVACRLVMLDNAEGEERKPIANQLSTVVPLAGMVAMLLLRSADVLQLSDMLCRGLFFIPLFLKFLMSAHRASVEPKIKDNVVKILSNKLLVSLGGISFPIFVLHGPIGQICYKRVVANKLFGNTLNKKFGPQFFYAYLAIVFASSWFTQKLFLGNKAVSNWSRTTADKLSAKL